MPLYVSFLFKGYVHPQRFPNTFLCGVIYYKVMIIPALLFTVTRAPRYFGILQDHRGQPLSVEISEEYMDQDYIATNRYNKLKMGHN